MKYKEIGFLYLLITLLILGCGNSEKKDQKGKTINSDYYELVNDWPKLPDNFTLGSPSGLGIDTYGNIIVFHRSGRGWDSMPISHLPLIKENTISKIDARTGEILESWGDNLFIMPHGLEVDNHNNIWVTDSGLHQVFKFDSL